MRSTYVLGVLFNLGVLTGCGGASSHGPDPDPEQAGAPAVSNGENERGRANDLPSTHAVAEFCSGKKCPGSPADVQPFCKVCPATSMNTPACTENIYGTTHRYQSSCGGTSVEVTYGFDVTVWQFDADGQLVGVSWSSDTSSARYGRQCTRTGEPEDLCAPGAGGANAGAAG